MSTKECFHSTQAAWPPGGPKPETPSGSLPKAAGVPRTAQHRYLAPAPREFGFLLQQQKIHIPMVLAKSSVGRRGPEKGLTYGRRERKGEKLKEKKCSTESEGEGSEVVVAVCCFPPAVSLLEI